MRSERATRAELSATPNWPVSLARRIATTEALMAMSNSVPPSPGSEGRRGLDTAATHRRLGGLLPAYRDRYPHGYRFAAGPTPPTRSARPAPVLFRLVLRPAAEYRVADQLLLNRHVSRAKAALARRLAGALPPFLDRQGMSAETLLR